MDEGMDRWMEGWFARQIIRSFMSNWTCTSFKKFHDYLFHKSFSSILKAISVHFRFTQLNWPAWAVYLGTV